MRSSSFHVVASVVALFAVVEGCRTEPDAGEPAASLGSEPTEIGDPAPDVPATDAEGRAVPPGPLEADAATSARRKCKAVPVLKNAAGAVDVAPIMRFALTLEAPTAVIRS